MNRLLLRTITAFTSVILLLAGNAAFAAIASTKHNLGSDGTGSNSFTGTSEICVFCHTPHGANTSAAVPLWNRNISSNTAYTTFDSLGTTSLDSAVASVGSVSIACLSCHDGTQAMDTIINEPGSGLDVTGYSGGGWTGNNSPQGVANLGLDLTNDHPIGILYGGGGLTQSSPSATMTDADFNTALSQTLNGTEIWWVDTDADSTRDKTDIQLYTRNLSSTGFAGEPQPFVECASCHDPHSGNTTFLRIENTNSAVCLACHNK